MAGWLRAPPLLGADADKRENKLKRIPTREAFDSAHEFKSVAVGVLAKAEPPPKPQRPPPRRPFERPPSRGLGVGSVVAGNCEFEGIGTGEL